MAICTHSQRVKTSCVTLNVVALFSRWEFPFHVRFRPRDKRQCFMCSRKNSRFSFHALNVAIMSAHQVALIFIPLLAMRTNRLRSWWVMATSAVAECSQLTIEINCETCLRLRWLSWRLFLVAGGNRNWISRRNAFSPPRLVIATETSHREFQVSTSMRNCLHLECARHIRPHDPRESVSNLSRRKAIRNADDALWCSGGEKWKLMNLWWAIESWWCMKGVKSERLRAAWIVLGKIETWKMIRGVIGGGGGGWKEQQTNELSWLNRLCSTCYLFSVSRHPYQL